MLAGLQARMCQPWKARGPGAGEETASSGSFQSTSFTLWLSVLQFSDFFCHKLISPLKEILISHAMLVISHFSICFFFLPYKYVKQSWKSYMNIVCESCPVVLDSAITWAIYSPWNSPGQNTGVGSHSLLQGIFPTQESNPGLLHCRQILYCLSHQGPWS